jgi:AcrR family transcriptional regulator
MGISERKAKEKEDLKALILDGARKLFVEKGMEHTTIRNIADEIEYSVGTVYVYYKDKNAILHDLHHMGFTQLGNEFKVLFNVGDPMERLKAMGRVYIRFAMENPEMYDLMFNMKAPMEFLKDHCSDGWSEGQGTFDVLMGTVGDCMSKGHFKGHQLDPLSFMIWSLVHGMCALHIRERIGGVKLANPEHIVEQAYEEFLHLIDNQ